MDGLDRTWTLLHLEDDVERARTLVTSIAAMEFDARLVCAATGAELVGREGAARRGPVRVEVCAGDWADLDDVLDELIDEQCQFDLRLRGRRCRSAVAYGIMLALTALGALVAMAWGRV